MAINSKVRESKDFGKKVGIFEAEIVAINPTKDELEALLGTEVEKEPEYVGQKEVSLKDDEKEMVDSVRVAVYLKDVKSNQIFNTSFYLENREKANKAGTKFQYINGFGSTSWAEEEDQLPSWFIKGDVRKAKVGEEDLYEFVKTWLKLDFKDPDFSLDLEFNNLIKGDFSVLKNELKGKLTQHVLALATVKVKEVEGQQKEYQGVYNKAFLQPYNKKFFVSKKYTEEGIAALRARPSKELKPHEKFVVKVSDGEYGVKDAYTLEELKEYDGATYLPASDAVMDNSSGDY